MAIVISGPGRKKKTGYATGSTQWCIHKNYHYAFKCRKILNLNFGRCISFGHKTLPLGKLNWYQSVDQWQLFVILCAWVTDGVPLISGGHTPNEDSFFFLWRCDSTWIMASSFLRFLDHTQRRTTVGRTSLDEWSAHRRDLCLTTHNTHNRQTSMPPVGWNPRSQQASGRRPTP